MKDFNKYYRRLEAACLNSVHPLLSARATALRKSIEDGVVGESSAIKHITSYAKELCDSAEDWMVIDELLKHPGNNPFVKDSYLPVVARTKRGDFDGPNFNKFGENMPEVGYFWTYPLNTPDK